MLSFAVVCVAPSVWVAFLSYSGACVALHMQCEVVWTREGLLTDLTVEGLVSGVLAKVPSQLIRPGKTPSAVFPAAGIRFLPRVWAEVSLQVRAFGVELVTARLGTHVDFLLAVTRVPPSQGWLSIVIQGGWWIWATAAGCWLCRWCGRSQGDRDETRELGRCQLGQLCRETVQNRCPGVCRNWCKVLASVVSWERWCHDRVVWATWDSTESHWCQMRFWEWVRATVIRGWLQFAAGMQLVDMRFHHERYLASWIDYNFLEDVLCVSVFFAWRFRLYARYFVLQRKEAVQRAR